MICLFNNQYGRQMVVIVCDNISAGRRVVPLEVGGRPETIFSTKFAPINPSRSRGADEAVVLGSTRAFTLYTRTGIEESDEHSISRVVLTRVVHARERRASSFRARVRRAFPPWVGSFRRRAFGPLIR